jgi:phosphatidate phosphatase APP1
MADAHVVAYRGWGNTVEALVLGHAFRHYKLAPPHPDHSLWDNLLAALRRYRLKPLSGVEVEVEIEGQVQTTRTDNRGFFSCEIPLVAAKPGWHAYRYRSAGMVEWQEAALLIADPAAPGVISDVDDTWLVSHSTRWWHKLRLILGNNAYSRRPFERLDAWRAVLSEMNQGSLPGDFFYVSDSEWNLYDFLLDFFRLHRLPQGPFLLQNLKSGWEEVVFNRLPRISKADRIRSLLDFFPEKSFYLLGDSGQRDPEIYAAVVGEEPDRFLGVLIRDLPLRGDDARLRYFGRQIEAAGVPFHTFGA